MENTTVKELIEILQSMSPDAVICGIEFEDQEPVYKTFEICKEYKNVNYISDNGDIINGDVVAIY